MIISSLCTLFIVIIFLNLTSSERKITSMVERLYDVESEDFVRTMSHLLGPTMTLGNSVATLNNGDQIFPAMLNAIKNARYTICFETYVYWKGNIGNQFSEALSERARSGIKVHLLIDAIGAGKLDRKALRRMREAGVEIQRYHPLRWYTLTKINNRTHRKLLIIDGEIGFTGGVGIADAWLGRARHSDQWRDSHFQLNGPCVLQMQAAFMDNWIKTSNTVLHGPRYFPSPVEAGPILAQVFTSSPNGGAESMRLMYLLAITCARDEILLGNSYFLPDDLIIRTLVAAAKRGVRIEIILPGRHIDHNIVRNASWGRWGKLLEAGIMIHEYQPTMYHCKIMIVDSLWVSVGSNNFDNRSFRLNDEANLNIYDREFAHVEREQFFKDRNQSKLITYSAWKKRPFLGKIFEWLSGLLRHQL